MRARQVVSTPLKRRPPAPCRFWPIKWKLHQARNEKRSGSGLETVWFSSPQLSAGKLPPTASVHSPVGGLDRNLTVSLPKRWGCLTKAPSIKPLVRVGKVFGQVFDRWGALLAPALAALPDGGKIAPRRKRRVVRKRCRNGAVLPLCTVREPKLVHFWSGTGGRYPVPGRSGRGRGDAPGKTERR